MTSRRQTVIVLVSELQDCTQSVRFSSGRYMPRVGREGHGGADRKGSGWNRK